MPRKKKYTVNNMFIYSFENIWQQTYKIAASQSGNTKRQVNIYVALLYAKKTLGIEPVQACTR